MAKKTGGNNSKPAGKKRAAFLVPLSIFLSLLCFYSLLLSTHLDGYERGFFATALNFVEAHQFNMGGAGLAGTAEVGGKRYAEYVLESILDVPMVVAGIALDSIFALAGMHPQLVFFLPKGLNAILTALTAAILYLFALRLYGSEKTAAALAFIYGLATLAMPYATIGMDPLFVFLILFGFYLLRRCSDTGKTRLFAFAGLLFGLAMGAKTYAFLTYPFALFYIYRLNGEKRMEGLPAKLGTLVLGGLAGLIPYFWYNYLRFGEIVPVQRSFSMAGSIFQPSVMNFLYNLYASFFSAGKSFFLYSPPLVFVFWAVSRSLKRNRTETLVFLSLISGIVVFFCITGSWADEVWGTRYYLILVPFLTLMTGVVIEKLKETGRWFRFAFYASVITGFMVQIPGAIVYYGTFTQILIRNKLYTVQNAFYIPALSHIRMNVFLIWATIERYFTGVFPAYYYRPYSNLPYLIKFAPIQMVIDPNEDYISVWWHQVLSLPDLTGFPMFLVVLLVTALFAGFLFFGMKAWRLAVLSDNKGRGV